MNHLLPDVTELLTDPELGAQPFTVHRGHGSWTGGRFIVTKAEELPVVGNIQPATPEELAQFPQGDIKRGMIVIRSTTELYLTDKGIPEDGVSANISDEITWNGHRYKVVRCDPWVDYGFFVAYAAMRAGHSPA